MRLFVCRAGDGGAREGAGEGGEGAVKKCPRGKRKRRQEGGTRALGNRAAVRAGTLLGERAAAGKKGGPTNAHAPPRRRAARRRREGGMLSPPPPTSPKLKTGRSREGAPACPAAAAGCPTGPAWRRRCGGRGAAAAAATTSRAAAGGGPSCRAAAHPARARRPRERLRPPERAAPALPVEQERVRTGKPPPEGVQQHCLLRNLGRPPALRAA